MKHLVKEHAKFAIKLQSILGDVKKSYSGHQDLVRVNFNPGGLKWIELYFNQAENLAGITAPGTRSYRKI